MDLPASDPSDRSPTSNRHPRHPNKQNSAPKTSQPHAQTTARRQAKPTQPSPALKSLMERLELLENEHGRLQEELQNQRRQEERQNGPRDVQIEGLKEFLDTHDKCGVADVLVKLDLVNDLIDQLATDIADLYQVPQSEKPSESTVARSSKELELAIGSRLAGILDTCDASDPNVAVLFQYAAQTVLLFEVYKICDVDFGFRAGEPRTHLLHLISRRLQLQEIQPIYGRWRALAHHHLRASETEEAQEQSIASFVSRASGLLTDVHDAILGVPSTSEQRSQIPPYTKTALKELYIHANQLSVMIKEEVISTDLTVYAPRPKTVFKPDGMEFPYDDSRDDRPPGPDYVISSVKLGLLSKGKRGRENGPPEEKMTKKAQVFTEQVLDVILPSFRSSSSAGQVDSEA